MKNLDEQVEAQIAEIAQLETARRIYDRAKSDSEKTEARNLAFGVLNSALERGVDREDEAAVQRYQEQRKMLENELANDTYRKIQEGLGQRVQETGEGYEENIDFIKGVIVETIDDALSAVDGSEDYAKDRAVRKITPYLRELGIKLDQEQADQILEGDFQRKVRIPTTEYHNGAANTDVEEEFQYRATANEMLVEKKDKEGNVASYSIDEEKLSGLIKNPVVGSLFYGLTQQKEAA